MTSISKEIYRASEGFNALAGVAVIVMMLLTCADVLLRLLRHPIPGTYELVGFLGTVIASFSLACTSLEKGHIAVEIIVDRLPRHLQIVIETFTSLTGAVLFGLIAWQSAVYALDMWKSGEVSVTLTMPIYPFIFGIAAGCALLSVALLDDGLRSAIRMVKQ